MMGSKTQASFASLTNWGKKLEGCGEESEEKERAGVEAGRGDTGDTI